MAGVSGSCHVAREGAGSSSASRARDTNTVFLPPHLRLKKKTARRAAMASLCRFVHTRRGCTGGALCLDLLPPGVAQPEPVQSQPKGTFKSPTFNNNIVVSLESEHTDALFPTDGFAPDRALAHMQSHTMGNLTPDQRPVDRVGLVLMSLRSWKLEEERQALITCVADGAAPVLTYILGSNRISTAHCCDGNTLSFQQVYLPILLFLTSEAVLTSPLEQKKKLYNVVDASLLRILAIVKLALEQMRDLQVLNPAEQHAVSWTLSSAIQVVRPVVLLLVNYMSLFPDSSSTHRKQLSDFVGFLAVWTADWSVTASPDVDAWRKLNRDQQNISRDRLLDGITRLNTQVQVACAAGAPSVAERAAALASGASNIGQLALLRRVYRPPGALSARGPRHDNDFADIQRIQIAPTSAELQCTTEPFLPATIAGAPHHLPEGSVPKLLDTQFRLLRQEIVAPLQETLSALCKDLTEHYRLPAAGRSKNTLSQLLLKGGGMFRGPNGSPDVRTYGYGQVRFGPVRATNKGAAISLCLPPAQGHSSARGYWYGILTRSLGYGALVAYVVQSPTDAAPLVFVGSVASFRGNVDEMGNLNISIAFYDEAMYARAFQHPRPAQQVDLLVEVPGVIMDTLEPFLRVLQQTAANPARMPFARYLTPRVLPADMQVLVPAYARVQGFRYDLSGLLRPGAQVQQLFLTPTSLQSRNVARAALKAHGILDLSQADAIVDSLTREVALIQGPPGTGKSFTGVNLVKTLIRSGVSLIVVMCQTNHAIDTFLGALLDQNVSKILRLGSRSKDERIQRLAIDNLMRRRRKKRSPAARAASGRVRLAEQALTQAAAAASSTELSVVELKRYLTAKQPAQLRALEIPPPLIAEMWESERTWIADGAAPPPPDAPKPTDDFAEFWLKGRDLDLLEQWLAEEAAAREAEAEVGANVVTVDSLAKWGWQEYEDNGIAIAAAAQPAQAGGEQAVGRVDLPAVPIEQRPLAVLFQDTAVWRFSKAERAHVAAAWKNTLRATAAVELKTARTVLEEARKTFQDEKIKERVALARGFNIIGCTTTGAASFSELLEKLEPTVLVVEEAGEVLEAHVLAALNPSLQHLMLIGDPMQLRPHVSTYALSIENTRGGGDKYRLDLSLMERLATETGIDMSQIDIQRRMRPDFADLVRPLYRNLLDHEGCLNRPNIRGMGANLAFTNHSNAESSGRGLGTSKANEYEVEMAVAMARHFVKQGYNGAGDICILVTYLGQLNRIRQRLERERITTIVDERDVQELHMMGADLPDRDLSHTTLAGCLRLASVDNFQGEEAKIIILSTVRNSGADDDDDNGFIPPVLRRSGIGFVKSTNRANVALSRARDGLYIFGNASLLSKHSTFWNGVISTLQAKGSVVKGVPLRCSKHPQQIISATTAAAIGQFAPDGGCSLPCLALLGCGHSCERKCHPGDPNHRVNRCSKPCPKVHALCGHACSKLCSESCGLCTFKVPSVNLPCGHVAVNVPCFQIAAGSVQCQTLVDRQLPFCEHVANMTCSQDPRFFNCLVPCGKRLTCCNDRPCPNTCGDCQRRSVGNFAPQGRVERTLHGNHPCGKARNDCTHACAEVCSLPHIADGCGSCKERCATTQCAHSACTLPCSKPCRICPEECAWQACEHVEACLDACGTPCSRLPCDEPCPNQLKCGHACPSICSEPCDAQLCPTCATDAQKAAVMDVTEGRILGEIDLDAEGLDNRLITLACGHAWTVATLDATLKLEFFYTRDDEGRWASLAMPPAGFFKRRGCPTCRGPITALRYGRVNNRASWDRHEEVLWATQTRQLAQIQKQDANLRASRPTKPNAHELSQATGRRDAKPLAALKPQERRANLVRLLRTSQTQPDWLFLTEKLAGTMIWGGMQRELSKIWRAFAGHVLSLRQSCQEICKLESPHVLAWGEAMDIAFQRAREEYPDVDLQADEKAMEDAKRSVAVPEPMAEQRVRLEAFGIALQLNLWLLDLAENFLAALQQHSPMQAAAFRWQVLLIIEGGKQDAEKALALAESADYHRLALEARLHRYRFEFEDQRFNALAEIETPRLQDDAEHVALVRRLIERLNRAELDMRGHVREFLEGGDAKDRHWYQSHILAAITSVTDEAQSLIRAIDHDEEYEPVARKALDKDFDFGDNASFYRCPLGHSYCVGAGAGNAENAVCPDCPAPDPAPAPARQPRLSINGSALARQQGGAQAQA